MKQKGTQFYMITAKVQVKENIVLFDSSTSANVQPYLYYIKTKTVMLFVW